MSTSTSLFYYKPLLLHYTHHSSSFLACTTLLIDHIVPFTANNSSVNSERIYCQTTTPCPAINFYKILTSILCHTWKWTGKITFAFISLSLSLSHHFSSHFSGGPGLAITRTSPFWILLELRMTKVVVTTGARRRAKLQPNHHHQQTNIQLFTGWMPFLSSKQWCQSTDQKH